MDHGNSGGTGGGCIKSGDGTQSTSSYGDNSNTVYGGTKTITFPLTFNTIPYILISPASGNSYKTSNDGSLNPPTAWYHDESSTGFTAELSTTSVKLTWIAVGTWK